MNRNRKVELSYTEQYLYESEIVGDTFAINIALPKNYDDRKQYPVAYLTDANIFFGLVAETARLLQFGDEIPEIIVVGIAYPDDSKHLVLRNRDLGPTPGDLPEPAGNAEKFLDFLVSELKPFIKRHYFVSEDDSCLIGDSMGGLFALYALLNKPTEFQRYIIGSPSIYWDDSVIFKMEAEFAENNKSLPAKVFISAGQLEAIREPVYAGMLSNVAKMIEILNSRVHSGFSLCGHIFNDETHLSVIPATFSKGLRAVYN